MRIISGKFKGKKLKPPSDYSIRPTLDRVKESIFNIISPYMEGARVLDLFAGTGSLGIEALSRGCSLVYFVDNSPQSISLIKHNTAKLGDMQENFRIFRSDISKFLVSGENKVWDIVFLDPPYKIEAYVMKEIFDILAKKEITHEDTVIIYEYFFKRDVGPEIGSLREIKESFFGDKKVKYLKP